MSCFWLVIVIYVTPYTIEWVISSIRQSNTNITNKRNGLTLTHACYICDFPCYLQWVFISSSNLANSFFDCLWFVVFIYAMLHVIYSRWSCPPSIQQDIINITIMPWCSIWHVVVIYVMSHAISNGMLRCH